MNLKEYVDKYNDTFELISESTNMVYKFNFKNKGYILKICKMNKDNLSPFWLNMKYLFDYDFSEHIENISVLYKKLRNKYITVARPVYSDPIQNIQIFERINGEEYEPDIFPGNENIHLKLGEYISHIHETTYEKYGNLLNQNKMKECIKKSIIEVMEKTIEKYWTNDKNVLTYFNKIKEIEFQTSGFSLIMPDISGNQFIYSKGLNKINGIVDIDAYVIGPKEFELSIIEMCIPDYNCAKYFVKGYEKRNKIPKVGNTRNMYRMFAYLCDPNTKETLESFLNDRIYFQ